MKKLISIILAVMLILSLSVTAFAATSAPTTTHTYVAYQIFSGTQAADSNEIGNVQWGSGINAADFLAALQADTTIGTVFANCTTAADVADAMKGWADDSDNAKAFAKIANDYVVEDEGITVVNNQTQLDPGYYLVVDETEEVGKGDAYNLSLLQLTQKGTFEITQKTEVPEVEKKLTDDRNGLTCTQLDPDADDYDEDHVHTKDCYNWSDANQVAIGDTVHFKVESAVPATAADYDYYYFIIGDTLSSGLTLDEDSIKVFIDGTEAAASAYTLKTGDDTDRTFEIALKDAIANAGKTVTVTYDAVLNENAVIGADGNPNAVDVKYSNNPNEDYDGTQDNDNPGFPASEEDTPLGETPKDITKTYTTQIRVYKVDGNNEPLQGAEFTLTGEGMNIVLVYKEEFEEDAAGTYYKLKNGTYTETAPVTADYMKAAEEGATAGYVVDADYEGDDAVTIGETVYRPYNPTNDTEADVFVLVKANTDKYDSTTTKYKMTRTFTQQTAEAEEEGDTISVTAAVDENGEVMFTGLMAGDYTLSESKVPDGYNPVSDISFTIVGTPPTSITTGEETCTWSVQNNSAVTYNTDEQAFEVTVVNQKGNTLPETGGIGTTLFYAIGGVLVVAAGVLLITKKRMGNEE